MTFTDYLWFNTEKRQEFIRITDEVAAIVTKSGVTEGMVLVSAMHITAGVYVNDWEDGLIHDFQVWLEKLAPAGLNYRHHQTGEDNADAHLKRTIMGHQVILPITSGQARSRTVGTGVLCGVRRPAEEARGRQGDGGVSSREFPDRPVVGVGAVVVQDGRALIVKRAHEPRKGRVVAARRARRAGRDARRRACAREIKEETGLDVEVGELVEVFDRVHRLDGRVQYHFVIVDYLCRPIGGTLCAGDDAEDVAWVTADEIERYGVNEFAARVIRKVAAFVADEAAQAT